MGKVSAWDSTVDDREPRQSSELWERVLTGTQPQLRAGRRILKHLPADVRCKLCGAPLGGRPWAHADHRQRPLGQNPTFCRSCFTFLVDNRGGAEIVCSLLFADVRGSTTIAEGMRPAEVHDLMNRFFRTAAKVLVEHDAIVDRFVGDQAIENIVPALAGSRHAARAIDAAQALLSATGHGDPTPSNSVGAGVHTGTAFVGSVGSETQMDFTALGDTVNIAARLSSAAAVGETLVTLRTSADLDPAQIERRDLALKGKHAHIGAGPHINTQRAASLGTAPKTRSRRRGTRLVGSNDREEKGHRWGSTSGNLRSGRAATRRLLADLADVDRRHRGHPVDPVPPRRPAPHGPGRPRRDNSVRLVADKPAWVRVYAGSF